MYSQNNEEEIILQFFKGSATGTFLDIGAYNPFKFSNTRALYEKGFKGVFVEPSPTLKPAFDQAYGRDEGIQLLPLCIGARNGVVDFYNACGDAVSTTIKEPRRKIRTAADRDGRRSDPAQPVPVSDVRFHQYRYGR